MKHLLVSREYPPSTYPRGGIGTYVEHIARLLAGRGETVHVVAELWDGAPLVREVQHDGRLIVHRVPLGHPIDSLTPAAEIDGAARVLDSMAATEFPAQSFSWQAALQIEALIESDGIDVIEGQDYEAPLYYLLLRRAAGLGPARRPPCFVHLHSPWELVCHANGWGLASAYDVTIKRHEDYAIGAADAALCPSEFLAVQAERHYGLEPGSVERIPYPIGQTPFVERPAATWAHGPICYFGRLEGRKGVLEWLTAAIDVAGSHPHLRFEFIGADTSLTGERDSSMRRALEARIPARLSSCFTFSDALPRDALLERLAAARLAVVPSRWENFPNTCVEAMCSGLPVLASPHGGMAEMIEDGRTGWIAASGQPGHLAAALLRALELPPPTWQQMGREASASIRRQCDNEATLDRQMAFRRTLVAQGARRSADVPSMPVWTPPGAATWAAPGERTRNGTPDGGTDPQPPVAHSAAGAGLVIVILDEGVADLDACLESVARQTTPATAVVVITADAGRGSRYAGTHAHWHFLREPGLAPAGARDAGLRHVMGGDPVPLAVAMIDAGCRLHPEYVTSCLAAFERHPRVGVVSAWSEDRRADAMRIRPQPSLPYQWIVDDVSECCAIRASALADREWMHELAGGAPAFRDLGTTVIVQGWLAITCPAVLSSRVESVPAERAALELGARARFRSALLVRFGRRLAQDAPLLVHLTQASADSGDAVGGALPRHVGRGALSLGTVLRLPVAEQVVLMRRALRNPGYAADWLKRHMRRRRGVVKAD